MQSLFTYAGARVLNSIEGVYFADRGVFKNFIQLFRVSPMPVWKCHLSKTWLTTDTDTAAIDALQLATGYLTWTAVATTTRLRIQ